MARLNWVLYIFEVSWMRPQALPPWSLLQERKLSPSSSRKVRQRGVRMSSTSAVDHQAHNKETVVLNWLMPLHDYSGSFSARAKCRVTVRSILY
ncbi:hypothetical protein V5799_006884 [Amblyomma americanum]|uniref:Uncharacterized protein n=1 Tax=Amblyomma americanum TaxID=6943 RepID=A0AAQ4DV44_AMBAM